MTKRFGQRGQIKMRLFKLFGFGESHAALIVIIRLKFQTSASFLKLFCRGLQQLHSRLAQMLSKDRFILCAISIAAIGLEEFIKYRQPVAVCWHGKSKLF